MPANGNRRLLHRECESTPQCREIRQVSGNGEQVLSHANSGTLVRVHQIAFFRIGGTWDYRELLDCSAHSAQLFADMGEALHATLEFFRQPAEEWRFVPVFEEIELRDNVIALLPCTDHFKEA